MNASLSTSPSGVKPETPIRYTQGGRVWWISVTRTCGHIDQIPDDDSVHGAQEFAARADVKCGRCRQADWQAERDAAPYSSPPRRPSRSSNPSHAGRSPSRDTDSRSSRTRSASRKQRPSRDDQINDASWWYINADDFLQAVARGEIQASQHSIAYAKNKRADALRTLRALGAVA